MTGGGRGADGTPGGAARIEQAGEQRSARIESLRALAALGVVVSHVYGATFAFGPTVYASFSHRVLLGGGDGVWVFFVLTGYLLFWPFVSRIFGGGTVDMRRYALNRALRILPLYYAAVVVFLLVGEHGGTFDQWWRFGLFAENFSTSTLERVDGVMWSLVIELQFYVLLPLLAWGLGRLARGSLHRTALVVGSMGLISLTFRLAVTEFAGGPHPLWQFSLPATFFFFAAGMLLALGRIAWERAEPGWARGPLTSGNLWLLSSLPFWALAFWRYNLHPLVAIAAFLMIGACVLPLRAGRLVRALEWRPIAAIGVASYSLYLWHFPIALHLGKAAFFRGHLVRALTLEIPLFVGIAFVSYAVVEAPFLRLRRRWSAAAPATAAVRAGKRSWLPAAWMRKGTRRPAERPPSP